MRAEGGEKAEQRSNDGRAVYPQPFIKAVGVGDSGVHWFLFVWYPRLVLIDTVTPLFIHYHTHNLFMPCCVFFFIHCGTSVESCSVIKQWWEQARVWV